MNNLTKTIVPVHLDGLFVPAQGSVDTVVPLVDFSNLNPEHLYLGEELTSLPLTLAQSTARLSAGVHLHWALPDALTKTTGLQLAGLQTFRNIFGAAKGTAIWQTLLTAKWIEVLPGQNNLAKVLVARNKRDTFPPGILTDDISAVNSMLDQPSFPAVPNRWLISRFSGQGNKPEKQWMVESDYVWPPGSEKDSVDRSLQDNYTAYPFRTADNNEILEYRFVGRSYSLGETPSADGSYLADPLTAVGYGEPTFAAFYPDCSTVFGFVDIENTSAANQNNYEVLGWYNDPQQDYYRLFIDAFTLPDIDPYLQLLAAVKAEFNWFIPVKVSKSDFTNTGAGTWDLLIEKAWLEDVQDDTASLGTLPLEQANTLGIENEELENKIRLVLNKLIQDQLPGSTLFYARVHQNNSLPNKALQDIDKISLAVGNTAAEAMSAFLASAIAPGQQQATAREMVENYLEALQLEPVIAGRQIDLGAKFKEARHQNSFSAANGGIIWSVRSINKVSQTAAAVKQAEDARTAQKAYDKIEEVTLPDDMADILNELNIRQQQLDQCSDQVISLQQQIFADWSAYIKMQGVYLQNTSTGSGNGGDPDPQNGGASGQNGADAPVDQNNQGDNNDWEGNFRLMHDFMDWQISTSLDGLQKNAAALQKQVLDLKGNLQNKLLENKLADRYELKPKAAPRYWQPAEPVLLITGLKASLRHGRDGRMRDDKLLFCATTELTEIPTKIYDKYAEVLNLVDFPFTDSSMDWHPLLLDWKIEFRQTKNTGEHNQYTEDYLEANYNLDLNAVDFTSKASGTDNSIPFLGRSILTPSANLLQKDVLIRKLVPDIVAAMKSGDFNKTDSDGMKEWLKAKSINDPALLSIIGNPLYNQPGEWIAARLTGIYDDHLGGILGWYQKQVEDSINNDLGILITAGHVGSFVQQMMDDKPLRELYYDQQVNKTPDDQQYDLYLKQDKDFIPWLKTKMVNAWPLYFSTHAAVDNEESYAEDNFDTMISWYADFAKNCLHRVLTLQAYLDVYLEEGLSQSLSGFNNALLNISQSHQLNIADPDEQYKGFAQKVREAVKQQNNFTKRSSGDFSPFRAGNIRFTNLNLVNNFGQVQEIDLASGPGKTIVKTAAMRSAFSDEITLTPRLAQPARLNFRWLSAQPSILPDDLKGQYLAEMNSHPASSPVCGWLMTNQLDNSIMCYDHKGTVLGYIDMGGKWQIFPGLIKPEDPTHIDNIHLAKIVGRLCNLGQKNDNYIADLIDTIDTALENTETSNSTQQDALALLIGRPIAIVRAAFGLEQKGLSSTFQRSSPTDDELLNDLSQFFNLKSKAGTAPVSPADFKRNTLNYESVKVPFRIGAYRQLNDGLIGYWVDKRQDAGNSEDADIFYSPQSYDLGRTADGLILTHNEDGPGFQFHLQISDKEPFEVTMLMDVFGKVHASCGLLPVKSLEVPADHYKQALANIEVAFLTAPLLTLPGRLHVSLPREPGYGWSWVEKDSNGWRTINADGTINRKDVQRLFNGNAPKIWNLLTAGGWLSSFDDENANVVAVENRKEAKLDSAGFKALVTQTLPATATAADIDMAGEVMLNNIEQMLEGTHINPFDAVAAFSGTPEIREGWLKLTKVNG